MVSTEESKPTFLERAFLRNTLSGLEADLRSADFNKDTVNAAYELALTPEYQNHLFKEYLQYKAKGIGILTEKEKLLRHIVFRKAVLIALPVIEVATGLVAIGIFR